MSSCFFLRPACWLRGHIWRVTKVIQRAHVHLMHLHPLAGCDAVCRRCGKVWLDAANFERWPWL